MPIIDKLVVLRIHSSLIPLLINLIVFFSSILNWTDIPTRVTSGTYFNLKLLQLDVVECDVLLKIMCIYIFFSFLVIFFYKELP